MKTTAWECDGCGSRKGEANHWFVMIPLCSAGQIGVAVFPWDEETAGGQNAKHLCGAGCVHAAISQQFDGGKDESGRVAAAVACDRT